MKNILPAIILAVTATTAFASTSVVENDNVEANKKMLTGKTVTNSKELLRYDKGSLKLADKTSEYSSCYKKENKTTEIPRKTPITNMIRCQYHSNSLTDHFSYLLDLNNFNISMSLVVDNPNIQKIEFYNHKNRDIMGLMLDSVQSIDAIREAIINNRVSESSPEIYKYLYGDETHGGSKYKDDYYKVGEISLDTTYKVGKRVPLNLLMRVGSRTAAYGHCYGYGYLGSIEMFIHYKGGGLDRFNLLSSNVIKNMCEDIDPVTNMPSYVVPDFQILNDLSDNDSKKVYFWKYTSGDIDLVIK